MRSLLLFAAIAAVVSFLVPCQPASAQCPTCPNSRCTLSVDVSAEVVPPAPILSAQASILKPQDSSPRRAQPRWSPLDAARRPVRSHLRPWRSWRHVRLLPR